MKFSELIAQLGDLVLDSRLDTAQGDPEISGVAAIDDAITASLSYVESAKFAPQIATTQASALILPPDEGIQARANERAIPWLSTREPRLAFARAIALFYQPFHPESEIHPSATVDPEAEIGEGVYIGPHVTVGAGVKIGHRVCLHANTVIYPDVEIGDRAILHANCTIHERTRIGADCVIHSGVVIGGEGFGFVATDNGWVKMEQSGCTVLEDGVEVGSNSTIDRPAVGETRIGRQTKIDNLVQIGHGCQIGENCAIAAQVGLAGGVRVGDRVILAGQVGVSNQVRIGDGAIASAKSGIHSDIAPGEIVSGYPAINNKLWLKAVAIYNRLPEIYRSLKDVQRQLEKNSNN
ncbi:UDP-3-O-(3-hydroxymyristoyl)glucosamine N-acyltransferase [Oxynema sp. CENA135]|uniref:UDP-3-O-(3-hydroxymyristoyl)glucosamine N-acyltransferase n=1 Tax=Oxynema sp. CENA135 TaxID=984206 RepID=UPI00190A59FA|nr:UDP-3-O-(3-hydroxymyristoyl)glucosamine N-acyltransferase [Oxynema sp. CENA135]MBK4732873.1 UDP-3-O-(3-hydroxymyristoyl)glucosamine N-acyltransferase [Oxynema sp. CENA135]